MASRRARRTGRARWPRRRRSGCSITATTPTPSARARGAAMAVPDDPQLAAALARRVSSPQPSTASRPAPMSPSPPTGRSAPEWHAARPDAADAAFGMPRGQVRMRLVEAGIPARSRSPAPRRAMRFRLDPVGDRPTGMVRVAGGRDPSALRVTRRRRRLLDRSLRSHQPPVQGVRGSRRLPAPRVLAGAVRRRRSDRCRGRKRWRDFATAPAARARRRGRRVRYPDGQAEFPGRRCELVRSDGIRGVRRQEPADDVSLVSRGGAGAASPTS